MAYDAFISYSHAADGRLAPALQSGLQRLAKPWYRPRALRVFRDETGLSTNPYLWSSIVAALDESEWFVLLASPESATSTWVDKEIAHWLETKTAARILPALTNGEWGWDSEAGRLVGDAVPERLVTAITEEPRHLDLRWAHHETDLDLRNSGFRSAVADLAAPMHGVAKDELEGEDIRQHRRARRLARAAMIGLTVLLIVAIVLAVAAAVQRGRADQQASRARHQTTLADARRLAAQAVSATQDDLARSALLAIEGQRLHDDHDTRGALLTVLQQAMPIRTMIHGSWDAAAVAPDGRTLVVAGPQGVFRVDLRTRRFARLGSVRFVGLKSADFSADGRTVALGGEEVRLIDAHSGAAVRPPLRIPEAKNQIPQVTALRFSPNGHSLAALTGDGYGIVWSVPVGRELGRFYTTTFTVNGIDFSPDGQVLAGTGAPGFDVAITSLRPGYLAKTDPAADAEYTVAFSPDGTRVAVGQVGRIVFRNPTTGVVSGPVIDTGRSAAQLLSFSTDGRVIAAARNDGGVSLFDSTSGLSVRTPLVGATRSPLVLRFLRAKDALVLVTGAEIIVYDLAKQLGVRLRSRVPSSPAFARLGIAISSDGIVAVTDPSGGVEIWDAATMRERRRIVAARAVGFGASAIAFQPGTRFFALAAGDGTVSRWDADRGHRVGKSIALTAANPTFGLTYAGLGVFGVAFDSSGRTLAALAGDGTVAIIDTNAWKVLRRIKMQPALAHGAIALSPSGRTVAAGGPNSVAFASTSGAALRRLALGRVEVRSLAFSTERTVTAGLADGRIAVIDPDRATVTGPPLVSAHGGVDGVALDSSREHLASGNDDGTVRLWDLATRDDIGPPLSSQTKGVNALAFTPDDNTVIAAAGDATVVAYDLSLLHWVSSLCRIVGRNLTMTEWDRFLGDRTYEKTCADWESGY